MYDVIIIGGGVSGLMAAKILSANGQKILLLEARKELGGRIHSIREFDYPAEGGAEFIHGNLQTTFNLLKEAHLTKEKLKGNFCRVENGKWNTENNAMPHWNVLIKKLKECTRDESVDDFLEKHFTAKKYDALRKQFKRYIQGYDAADTKYASIQSVKMEMENEDEDQYRPVPGYSALIKFMEKYCTSHKVVIKKKEPVQKIIKEKNIEVITETGNYQCNKLITAVPVGVLQCNKAQQGYIEFPPFMKDHLSAAKKIGNGGVIKFLVQFDNAFWLTKDFLNSKKISPPSYIFTESAIPTWWTQYPHKVPILTGWIAGPPSNKMKNYSKKKFEEIIVTSLSAIMYLPVDVIKNRLKKIEVMNWIKEPYILGGYSYSTLQSEKARAILNKPFNNSFYFTGEYLTKNSSSTVDAALQSGREVAEKILNE